MFIHRPNWKQRNVVTGKGVNTYIITMGESLCIKLRKARFKGYVLYDSVYIGVLENSKPQRQRMN